MTVHTRPAADAHAAAEAARLRSGRFKMLLVLLICAAPVVASYFTYYVIRPTGRTNYSELVEPTRALPADLPLATLDGRAVASSSLKKQWLLVVVGGGACDDACQRRLFLVRQLREMTGAERGRIDKVWLVDDDHPVAPKLVDALRDPPTTLLRTPRDALARWLAPAPGHALEDHVYIVDPMGEWMMRVPADPDPKKVKADIDKLLRASASWDQPGR